MIDRRLAFEREREEEEEEGEEGEEGGGGALLNPGTPPSSLGRMPGSHYERLHLFIRFQGLRVTGGQEGSLCR